MAANTPQKMMPATGAGSRLVATKKVVRSRVTRSGFRLWAQGPVAHMRPWQMVKMMQEIMMPRLRTLWLS